MQQWQCSDCGAVHDRDINAARNILALGQERLAEGSLTLVSKDRTVGSVAGESLPGIPVLTALAAAAG